MNGKALKVFLSSSCAASGARVSLVSFGGMLGFSPDGMAEGASQRDPITKPKFQAGQRAPRVSLFFFSAADS